MAGGPCRKAAPIIPRRTERIEVLRGPQGRLFGANTTGGVVNIVAAQPSQNFGGKLEASIARFGNARK